MDSTKKLGISVVILAVLGGALMLQNKSKKADQKSHSFETKSADLPKLELSDDVIKTIDRVEITKPAKVAGEKGADGKEASETKPAETVILSKAGDDKWELTAPLKAPATASNVKSLLDNTKTLKVTDLISTSKDVYERWGVSDAKGMHVVLKKGNDAVLDLFLGEDGSRGQMVRLANKEGVFTVKGLSKFLYSRELKDWRDRDILHFEEADATHVSITNESGALDFKKEEGGWTSSFKPTKGSAKAIDKFKAAKVDDLVRAFRSLTAADFGDDKKPAEVGLEPAIASVTFDLKDGKQVVVHVGDTAEGTNRWARTNDHNAVFSISSWAADWATGGVSKFQDTPPKDGK